VVRQLGSFRLITSDMILVEVLDGFADRGEHVRRTAATAVLEITQDAAIEGHLPITSPFDNPKIAGGLLTARAAPAWLKKALEIFVLSPSSPDNAK
jgi:hypothetical protein